MDLASILGILIGIGSLILGYSMDGGNIKSLWLLSAAIIVVGGSLGSIAISYGLKDLLKMPSLFVLTFKKPKSTLAKTIDYIVKLSENARKEGLLSIEKIIDDEKAKEKPDPLLKRGMLMVIDGIDLEQIRELLETELSVYEEKNKTEISMFESFAGYAPAYGMIGTIIGLIKVLSNIDSPEQMTSSIAVAFITTLYGVIIANLLCLPTANKLKTKLDQHLLEQEMIIEGVCAIRNGINPKMLRDKLSIYLQAESGNSQKANTGNKNTAGKAKGKEQEKGNAQKKKQ